MSTRTTRAKAAAASAAQAAQTQSQSAHDSNNSVSVPVPSLDPPSNAVQTEKENMDVSAGTTKASTNGKGVGAGKSSKKVDVYCTCKREDDGTPMIYCGECKDWYHFSCVSLSEREAEDINVYICPSCSERTGLRTVMTWEGPDAVEEVVEPSSSSKPNTKPTKSQSRSKSSSAKPTNTKKLKISPAPTSTEVKKEPTPTEPIKPGSLSGPDHEPEPTPISLGPLSDSDPNSEEDDDYVAEEIRNTARGKRRPRKASYVSESDDSDLSDGHGAGKHRLKGRTRSPAVKRKQSMSQVHDDGPPNKKARGSKDKDKDKDLNPTDDPTRKYCLGKLEEVFRDIYLRYPHVRSASTNMDIEEGDSAVATQTVEKKPEELSEEEKNLVIEDAKRFTAELEQCVFEIYCEPDKMGKNSAGAKYKDRFRTLQFNLSKPDRIVIHKRIASSQISPKELSTMSSTDLANEELKQSIKIAEQEALEHSILQKTTAPRAKITHKGLEDIEDINGGSSNRERERQQQEEEEKMERERMARMRSSQQQSRQRTASLSVPPESPVVPHSSSSWGAPPPVPLHALSSTASDEMGSGSPLTPLQRPPLFLNTSSEMVLPEPELNLADLINIDDETASPAEHGVSSPPPPSLSPPSVQALTEIARPESVLESSSVSEAGPSTPVTPAPLSAMEPPKASFDLNSLWSLPKPIPATPASTSTSTPGGDASSSTAAASSSSPVLVLDKGPNDVVMEHLEEANDRDFDMFLEEKETASPEALQAVFHALPTVWSGKINMPLDSTLPQETPVIARQMGGKSLDSTSGRWKTLFPSDHMRIDGRVPVENSAKFLLQMRMNPTKELIAVAFTPANPEDDSSFKILSDFLIAKNRHGLVFPWGQRPKEYHPGREFYVIPLLSSNPLPDYMELLDDLRLPKIRSSNYLVGIWILNKGKLTSPPPTPVLPPPPIISTPPISTTPPVPPPSVGTAPTPTIPAPLANLAATLPVTVDQNALAQEIASLTPEQMSLISRALASVPGVSLPPIPSVPVPVQAPVHPPPPSASPVLQIPVQMPIQTWGGDTGPNYNHDYPYQQNEHAGGNRHGPPHDQYYGDRGHWDRGRSRGRGRGRGRGGSGSGDFSSSYKGPADSGWPRKRNSGPEGPSSPLRRWG